MRPVRGALLLPLLGAGRVAAENCAAEARGLRITLAPAAEPAGTGSIVFETWAAG